MEGTRAEWKKAGGKQGQRRFYLFLGTLEGNEIVFKAGVIHYIYILLGLKVISMEALLD